MGIQEGEGLSHLGVNNIHGAGFDKYKIFVEKYLAENKKPLTISSESAIFLSSIKLITVTGWFDLIQNGLVQITENPIPPEPLG